MGELNNLAAECNAPVIGADVTSNEDLENLFTKTKEHFGGGVDFILHSIGMSVNVRKGIPYYENNYDFTHKGFDISALSLHRVLQIAMKHGCHKRMGIGSCAYLYCCTARIP